MSNGSFRLIVRTGPNPGMVYELTKEVTLVGRDVANDIVLGDAEVSRQHARLTRTPGGFVLEDLGSTNGTYVNGERLSAPRVLNPSDLVGFGENVSLTFDSTAPEGAETVMSTPAQAPTDQPSPTPAQAGPAVSPPPPAPMVEEEGGSRKWIFAGVGCFVLLVVCVGTLFIMDAYAPDILYAPLRWFGF